LNDLIFRRIKDKNNETALDLIPNDDVELKELFRKSKVQASFSRDDIADGESGCLNYLLKTVVSDSHLCLDDDDGEPGSGSGSDDD